MDEAQLVLDGHAGIAVDAVSNISKDFFKALRVLCVCVSVLATARAQCQK